LDQIQGGQPINQNMIQSGPEERGVPFPRRGHYFLTALVATLLFAYGSFVPLEYRSISLAEAIEHFRAVRWLNLSVYSRADFVANLLLFIPLGYLWLGGLDTDRRGRLAWCVGLPMVVVMLGGVIVGIEFTQQWFPRRTVSQNDMLAEMVGTVIGVGIWLGWGRRNTQWLRRFFSTHTQAADWRIKLLHLYLVGLLAYMVLPLDVVMSPEEIRRKMQEGRIILLPFSDSYGGVFKMLWGMSTDVALFAPVGVLMRVGWMERGRMRSIGAACLLTAGLAAVLELIQVFIFTRYASTTDVVIAGVGGVVGAASSGPLYRYLEDQTAGAGSSRGSHRAAALVLGTLYVAVAIASFWYPFDFIWNWKRFQHQAGGVLSYPFMSYYWGTEYNAISNLMRSLMLFLPVGMVMRYGVRSGSGRAWWLPIFVGLVLGLIIELGQACTGSRTPDSTDVMLYTAGTVIGWVVVNRLIDGPRQA